MRLAIAGAGVFGLAIAVRAAAAGAQVQVWDPAPFGDNASGMAAGMIAPVGEVLFDASSAAHLDLFRAGRDRWSDLEALAPDLRLDRSGAVFLFDDHGAMEAAQRRLEGLGAECSLQTASPGSFDLFTSEDWRVDPLPALLALRAAIERAAGRVFPEGLDARHLGAFDAVVVAAGIESKAFSGLAPELSRLSPIKGQLLRGHGGPASGPTIRSLDLYIAPQPTGAIVGGSMELGRDDRRVERPVIDALRALAIQRSPKLAEQAFTGLAGVRASTPDGLPMAGPSSRSGVFIATGARRNGWLLAPLVSEILLSYLSGGDGGPFAAALDPRRFRSA